jgi:hypothetical protein
VKVADGAAAWTHKTKGEIKSSPVPRGDSLAAAYSRLQRRPRLRARSRQWQEVWEYEAAWPVTSSPAVAKGKVVVATADGQVICFG